MCLRSLVCSIVLLCGSSLGYGDLPQQHVDVVVLGSGVGGLTSAIYLVRSGLKTLVIEGNTPGGAITQSLGIQNWPGEWEISGWELIGKMRSQAEKNGASLLNAEVIEVDFSSRPFAFITQDVYDHSKKRKIFADLCIIATGSKSRSLEVPGEKKYWSKGVYTCAVCDGSLYKDKIVSVVGGGDSAVLEADYLSGLAKKVYVLVRKKQFKGVETQRRERLSKKENVEILYDVDVQEIKGSSAVEKIVVLHHSGKKQEIEVNAVFLAVGSTPNTQLFASQLQLTSNGYVALLDHFATSIPGVFAIGDVVDPTFRQAISAAGDGAKAAIQAHQAFSCKTTTVITKNKEPIKAIAKVFEVESQQQLQDLINNTTVPVILDFYATWCGPCRYLGNFVEGWAKDLQGKAIVCKVNVDVAHDLAVLYNIQSMPTLVRLDPQGKEMGRQTGASQIIQYIKDLSK